MQSGYALLTMVLFTPIASAQPEKPKANPLVTALGFSQRYATPEALTPAKDRQLKVVLTTALANNPKELSWDTLSPYFDKKTFQKFVGRENGITLEQMERLMNENPIKSREEMFEKVRKHCDLLATQFDLIEEQHREANDRFVSWIVKNYTADKPVSVIIICTGNTRRSMLGSTMGNVAAGYYGLPNVKFYSGGTNPIAFNPRTIATLKEIGVKIESTGKEAPRGKTGEANFIYEMHWGENQRTVEFSKLYNHKNTGENNVPTNPDKGFAAILVCSEADSACPKVNGADIRIPVPYLDPKAFDNAPFEAGKYAERRDDIGRFMLSAMMQARRRLELEGKIK